MHTVPVNEQIANRQFIWKSVLLRRPAVASFLQIICNKAKSADRSSQIVSAFKKVNIARMASLRMSSPSRSETRLSSVLWAYQKSNYDSKTGPNSVCIGGSFFREAQRES
jgi:hypothetical protein